MMAARRLQALLASGVVDDEQTKEEKREREEKRMLAGSAARNSGSVVSSWMDPDWVPEMLTVGAGGKGRNIRHGGMDGDMPSIGYGRKNPNERRRRK